MVKGLEVSSDVTFRGTEGQHFPDGRCGREESSQGSRIIRAISGTDAVPWARQRENTEEVKSREW